jgi:DNA (cytosine-5)-methyltransferase 1
VTLRALDLCCGVGGCSAGYAAAGFDVTGVDHVQQPEYPYRFVQADALTYPLDGYDLVHASPPCKRFTVAGAVHRANVLRLFDPNDDVLSPMLERLRAWGGAWIVEAVPGSPMPDDAVTCCGSAFGLVVRRHRLFASSLPLVGSGCRHDLQPYVVGVYGEGGAWVSQNGGDPSVRGGVKVAGRDAAIALGIDWTEDQRRLSQAIPPAYTLHLGRQARTLIEGRGIEGEGRGEGEGVAGGRGCRGGE